MISTIYKTRIKWAELEHMTQCISPLYTHFAKGSDNFSSFNAWYPSTIIIIIIIIIIMGAKGDWDFRISDLIKNPDGTDI